MTASLIELETLDLVSASRLLRLWVAEPVEQATRGLWSALASSSAMAGSDPGGAAWARSYDRAAAAALNAAADAINGVDVLAGMFAQTARNYEAADAASTPADRRVVEGSVATLPCIGTFTLPSCAPAPAAGGSGGGPHGWGLIEHLVGYVWPNGHQDRLRSAGSAWRRSAAALAHGADDTVQAASRAIVDRLPEAGDIWTVCNGMSSHLSELSGVHSALADACDELAHHLDQVHSEVIGELTSLVEWTAAIEASGAALSVITFGIAEAPTQAVETARIAKTAASVGALIEKFIAIARGLAVTVARLVEQADRIAAGLAGLNGARFSEAIVTHVELTRGALKLQELLAIRRLGVLAAPPRLVIGAEQLESKFKHAAVLGVTASRGKAGFKAFKTAIDRFLARGDTTRILGTYRGQSVILSYNLKTRIVIMQKIDGTFVSAWKLQRRQLFHVIRDRRLGGG